MKAVKTGLIFGFTFGIIDALLMLPISMADKYTAIIGASLNRFAIGYFIPTTDFPKQGWVRGLLIGVLLSLPDAIITKAYIPVLAIGAIGGLILGHLSDKQARK